jgi:hypothetical protein
VTVAATRRRFASHAASECISPSCVGSADKLHVQPRGRADQLPGRDFRDRRVLDVLAGEESDALIPSARSARAAVIAAPASGPPVNRAASPASQAYRSANP